jgi:hypothetical protein
VSELVFDVLSLLLADASWVDTWSREAQAHLQEPSSHGLA